MHTAWTIAIASVLAATLVACSDGSSTSASADGGGQDSGTVSGQNAAGSSADATAETADAVQDGEAISDADAGASLDATGDTSIGSCTGIQGASECPVIGATCEDGIVSCNGVSKPQTACACKATDPQSPKGYWTCEVNDCFGAPDTKGGGDVPTAPDGMAASD